MKKFLSISMMALALVFASSCNKDENGDSDASKCVNTWVSDEISITEIAGEDSFEDFPEELVAVLLPQLNNFKFQVAVDLAADGNGKAGVVVEKSKITLMESAVQALLTQYADKIDAEKLAEIQAVIAAVKPMLDNLKDGDLVGVAFNYTATATDSENGKITVTYKEKDDEGNTEEETTEVSYSGLSDNAVTFSVTDDEETKSIAFKSASSANVKVGDFVDATALKTLFGK